MTQLLLVVICFFFCFVLFFSFFLPVFSGLDDRKRLQQERLCDDGNRHECGGSGGGDRKLRIVAIEREREREIDQAHTKRKKL